MMKGQSELWLTGSDMGLFTRRCHECPLLDSSRAELVKYLPILSMHAEPSSPSSPSRLPTLRHIHNTSLSIQAYPKTTSTRQNRHTDPKAVHTDLAEDPKDPAEEDHYCIHLAESTAPEVVRHTGLEEAHHIDLVEVHRTDPEEVHQSEVEEEADRHILPDHSREIDDGLDLDIRCSLADHTTTDGHSWVVVAGSWIASSPTGVDRLVERNRAEIDRG